MDCFKRQLKPFESQSQSRYLAVVNSLETYVFMFTLFFRWAKKWSTACARQVPRTVKASSAIQWGFMPLWLVPSRLCVTLKRGRNTLFQARVEAGKTMPACPCYLSCFRPRLKHRDNWVRVSIPLITCRARAQKSGYTIYNSVCIYSVSMEEKRIFVVFVHQKSACVSWFLSIFLTSIQDKIFSLQAASTANISFVFKAKMLI